MRARALAAAIVVTAACGKSERTPAPATEPAEPRGKTAVLLLDIAAQPYGGTCSATESCPKDVACDPAKPYVVDCSVSLKFADVPHSYLGVMSDGSCHARPASCTEASCFDKQITPCPHQELPPLRVAYWAVENLGDTCEVTARGLAGGPDGAMKTAACPADYRMPIVGIYRESLKRCRVLEYVPRPLPPGTMTNPDEPRYVPCPAE